VCGVGVCVCGVGVCVCVVCVCVCVCCTQNSLPTKAISTAYKCDADGAVLRPTSGAG